MVHAKTIRLSALVMTVGFMLLAGTRIAHAIYCLPDEVVVISEKPNGTRQERCLSQEAADKLAGRDGIIVLPAGCPCWQGREIEVREEFLALIDEYQATPANEVKTWTCRFADDILRSGYPSIEVIAQLIFTDGTEHTRVAQAVKALSGPNQAHSGYYCQDFHRTPNNELWQARTFYGMFDDEYTRCENYINALRDICADVQ